MTLQTTRCKKCHYEEYDPPHGSTYASWTITNWISREPLEPIKCERCNKKMQIFYQAGHRRFWKCWDCNIVEVDKKFYENGERYADQDTKVTDGISKENKS